VSTFGCAQVITQVRHVEIPANDAQVIIIFIIINTELNWFESDFL